MPKTKRPPPEHLRKIGGYPELRKHFEMEEAHMLWDLARLYARDRDLVYPGTPPVTAADYWSDLYWGVWARAKERYKMKARQ